MTQYHITDDGPKPCTAKENCPIDGGNYYETQEEAQKAYENRQNSFTTLNKNKIVNKNLPQVSLTAKITPKKAGSYFGMSINSDFVKKHLDAWREYIGKEKADDMEQAKINRDGEYAFHVTIIKPKEARQLKKEGVDIELKDFNLKFKGIGSTKDNDKEAWYIIVESNEVEKYRKELDLPKSDLHITIGFKNGDIHNKSKGEETLKMV